MAKDGGGKRRTNRLGKCRRSTEECTLVIVVPVVRGESNDGGHSAVHCNHFDVRKEPAVAAIEADVDGFYSSDVLRVQCELTGRAALKIVAPLRGKEEREGIRRGRGRGKGREKGKGREREREREREGKGKGKGRRTVSNSNSLVLPWEPRRMM